MPSLRNWLIIGFNAAAVHAACTVTAPSDEELIGTGPLGSGAGGQGVGASGGSAGSGGSIFVPPEPTCFDQRQNGDETATDCGGSCDEPCGEGQGCEKNDDCQNTLQCIDGECIQPSCVDRVRNNSETDIDCGGSDPGCSRCSDGKTCVVNEDCRSSVCTEAEEDSRCAVPTCFDRTKNQNETDVDCAGECNRCAIGRTCRADSDCNALQCAPDVAVPSSGSCEAGATDCFCQNCDELVNSCRDNCRLFLNCFLQKNCDRLAECNTEAFCASWFRDYGGPTSTDMQLALAVLTCATESCNLTCQLPPWQQN